VTQIPSWLAALGILAPVATALGGYWFAGRNEEARDQRTAEREKRARRESFGERQVERRHAFQRELLLDLQTAMQREVRATARIVFQDQRTLREHGTLNQLPAGMSEEAYDAGVDMWRLQVRVLNDDLRGELEKLHEHASGVESSVALVKDLQAQEAIDQLGTLLNELTSRYANVNALLGQHLRAELDRRHRGRPQRVSPGAAVPQWHDGRIGCIGHGRSVDPDHDAQCSRRHTQAAPEPQHRQLAAAHRLVGMAPGLGGPVAQGTVRR